MKKLILLFTLILAGLFSAQKIDSVALMKESDMTKQFFADKKRGIKIGEFQFNDGNNLKVGDVVVIGRPSGIDYNVGYAGKVQMAYDNIMLGTPEGSLLKGIRYASATDIEGKEFRVARIAAGFGMGNANLAATMTPHNHKLAIDKYITVAGLDRSIKNGEVQLKNTKMTKDQAIKMLEEKKKLVDLGVISNDEFEKLREELKPIILQ